MGCACKNSTLPLKNDESLPINTDTVKKETVKNTVSRWITFIICLILSPIFILPIIYLLYKVIIDNKSIKITEMLKNLMKIIKYKIKMEQDGEFFGDYEVVESETK